MGGFCCWVSRVSMAAPKLPKPTTVVQVPAHEDGYPLFALLTVPEEEKMRGTSPVVILAPATAVPCGFYLAYLLYLAQNGIPSHSIGVAPMPVARHHAKPPSPTGGPRIWQG